VRPRCRTETIDLTYSAKVYRGLSAGTEYGI